MMDGLSARVAERKTIIIDATSLKAHRTASILRVSLEGKKTVRGTVCPTNGMPGG
jgi:hypothetical protein